jgi:hypothetical protein
LEIFDITANESILLLKQFGPEGSFDLNSDLFRKAAPRLWSAVRPWGRLTISGLMLDQIESVTEKVNEFSGRIEATRVRGKWATMLVQRTDRSGRAPRTSGFAPTHFSLSNSLVEKRARDI